MISTSMYKYVFFIQGQFSEEGYCWIELLNVFDACFAHKGTQRRKLLCFLSNFKLFQFLCQLDLRDN